MGSKTAAAAPVGANKPKEIVVAFDPSALRAPFFLRCGAAMIDYLLVVLVPVGGLLLSRSLGNDGTRLINSEINNFAWLLATVIAICDLILLPAVLGQSVGKMLTGLRIVKTNGETPKVGAIALRQTIGYLLTLASGGIGFVISILSGKGRTLHDYLSGTMVVYGRSKVR